MTPSPVRGLRVLERRVADPVATIVAVHGGLDRALSFSRVARRLERFDVLAYDRRGYQGSRDLGPGHFGDHVGDALAVAHVARERGPVLFVGHSFGGAVTTGACVAEATVATLNIAYESPFPWVLPKPNAHRAVSDDPAHEAERFFTRMVSLDVWNRLSEEERRSRHLDGPALLADVTLLDGSQRAFDVSLLATPSWYLYGDGPEADYYGALGRALAAESPLMRTRQLNGATHGVHLASPDLFAHTITQLWEQR